MDSKDKKLAEFVGILLGDGSLCLKDGRNTNNRMKVTLNKVDDVEYVEYVKNLIFELFGLEAKVHLRDSENATDLFLFNKKIILYLVNDVGLQLSPKWNRAVIPAKFLSPELGTYVIRGYVRNEPISEHDQEHAAGLSPPVLDILIQMAVLLQRIIMEPSILV